MKVYSPVIARALTMGGPPAGFPIDLLEGAHVQETVEHPPHYTFGKYEVIDVIEDWVLNFHLGNTVKYIARAGKKDPAKRTEDLKKALWYLQREIEKSQ